jgi:hypothetical protein
VAQGDAQDSQGEMGELTSNLASRLEDIPGVASVVVDLEGFGRGIDVRLEPGADEAAVMEKLRALLAAYGVRHENRPEVTHRPQPPIVEDPGVEVSITPLKGGARIEVSTRSVKSFRIVAATPMAIAQGLADAWCQVVGRVPVEVVEVAVGDEGSLTVVAKDGDRETQGIADVGNGWVAALTEAVAGALGARDNPGLEQAAS